MGQSICRGWCSTYDNCKHSSGGFGAGVRPYVLGYKRCTTCEYFRLINDNLCECCGKPLRLSSRSKKHKQEEHARY